MDRRAWNGPSYLPLRVMKEATEEFVKYQRAEAITAHHDYNGLSRGPSTRIRFDRFLVIRILILLDFLLLDFDSRLFDS